jgi:hypothetical protein
MAGTLRRRDRQVRMVAGADLRPSVTSRARRLSSAGTMKALPRCQSLLELHGERRVDERLPEALRRHWLLEEGQGLAELLEPVRLRVHALGDGR